MYILEKKMIIFLISANRKMNKKQVLSILASF